MKVLVSGATGFVGACLARRLAGLGHEVHILTRASSNDWRVADLGPVLTRHEVDLRDAVGVERVVAAVRPDTVFHLATYGGFSFQNDRDAIFATNFNATVNLVQACARVGVRRFVNTGSSSEYGHSATPMNELDRLEPLGDYAVAKAAATQYCRSEALLKGFPAVTLRVFSPYGPWDDPQRLVPYAAAALITGRVPALSNPSAVRDYIYIDDVVDAYLAVMDADIPSGEIYNVGSGVQTGVGEVVSALAAVLGSDVSPQWGALAPARPEPAVWVADVSKISAQCGWAATTALDAGLSRTVGWMRENLSFYAK